MIYIMFSRVPQRESNGQYFKIFTVITNDKTIDYDRNVNYSVTQIFRETFYLE